MTVTNILLKRSIFNSSYFKHFSSENSEKSDKPVKFYREDRELPRKLPNMNYEIDGENNIDVEYQNDESLVSRDNNSRKRRSSDSLKRPQG